MTAATPQLFKCISIPRGDWKDIFAVQSIRMAIIHNIVIRGFNSMLYYSGQIQPGTKQFQSFLSYCALANGFLHAHHDHEEKVWFPVLESKIGKGCMSGNIAQHKEFLEPFAAFEELVSSLQSDPSKFNVETFRKGIYDFIHVLREHLEEEIDTFRPDELRKFLTKEDLEQFEKDMAKEIQSQASLMTDPQLLIANGDSVFGPWFPEMPAPIMFVCRNILWSFHSDVWAFACCDKYMKVKPEFAAYEPELESEEKVDPARHPSTLASFVSA